MTLGADLACQNQAVSRIACLLRLQRRDAARDQQEHRQASWMLHRRPQQQDQQLHGVSLSAQSRQWEGSTSTRLPVSLTQPELVRRQRKTRACTLSSMTLSCRSRPQGALWIGCQLHIFSLYLRSSSPGLMQIKETGRRAPRERISPPRRRWRRAGRRDRRPVGRYRLRGTRCGRPRCIRLRRFHDRLRRAGSRAGRAGCAAAKAALGAGGVWVSAAPTVM